MAPTNGLNYRDSFLTLGPKDAVTLDNFIAQPTGCKVRGGFQKHAVGLVDSVNTLMSYYALNPLDSRLFACAGSNIFDVTNETVAGANTWNAGVWDASAWDTSDAPHETDSVDGIWSNVMFSGATKNYLCCTSPSGGYQTYDSEDGWTDRTAAVTGTSAPLGCITSWKNRLFIVGEGTNTVYYLPVNAIQGAVTELDLGPLMQHGGSIVAVTNWTLNAGLDIDDYLVFFGSQGDIIVFQGTDPDNFETFALKGIWYAGRPVEGNRFFVQYGGDILFYTEFGLFPLTKLVNGQVATEFGALSERIQPVLSPITFTNLNNPFWEVGVISDGTLLMLKLPQTDSQFVQYVMNLQTGAWSTFSGMPVNTQTTFNGIMYFGDQQGNVYKGLYSNLDNVDINGSGGNQIMCRAQGGFSDFGQPGAYKRFQMAYPIFISSSPPAVSVQMNLQYTFNPIYSTPNFPQSDSAGDWDVDNWDQCAWTGSTNTYAAWAGLQGIGYYGSLQVACRGTAGTLYVSTNVTVDVGGFM